MNVEVEIEKALATIDKHLQELHDYSKSRKDKYALESLDQVVPEVQSLLSTQESQPDALIDLLSDYLEQKRGYENRDAWHQGYELLNRLYAAEENATEQPSDEETASYYERTTLEKKRDFVLKAKAMESMVEEAAKRAGVTSNIVMDPSLSKEDPTALPSAWYIEVGEDGAGFTLFEEEDGKIIIDDLLEGGDEDFFHSPEQQAQYFALVKEILNPGSSQKGKYKTLYSARPVKDRSRYLTGDLPAGIFLATSLDHAEGLATDLGSKEVRDVWKFSIDDKDLVQTLDGPVKYYQLVRDQKARRAELLVPGK